MAIHNAIDYPVEQIRQWIADGQTQQQVADRLAVLEPRISAKLIYKVCKKHGIKCPPTGPRPGSGHPEWKGGKTVTRHGYIKVYAPDHPKCLRVTANRRAKQPTGYIRKDCYVWEHRLVMEKHLGRYLTEQEVIHHINGDPADNRLENLQLFANNAEHLAHDLAGKRPNWTEDGLARLRQKRNWLPSSPAPLEACVAQ